MLCKYLAELVNLERLCLLQLLLFSISNEIPLSVSLPLYNKGEMLSEFLTNYLPVTSTSQILNIITLKEKCYMD